MKQTMILKRERSEEEKARRRRFGDKGAKFSKAKIPTVAPPPHHRHNNHDGNKRPSPSRI